jgi:hypothetical protein
MNHAITKYVTGDNAAVTGKNQPDSHCLFFTQKSASFVKRGKFPQ